MQREEPNSGAHAYLRGFSQFRRNKTRDLNLVVELLFCLSDYKPLRLASTTRVRNCAIRKLRESVQSAGDLLDWCPGGDLAPH